MLGEVPTWLAAGGNTLARKTGCPSEFAVHIATGRGRDARPLRLSEVTDGTPSVAHTRAWPRTTCSADRNVPSTSDSSLPAVTARPTDSEERLGTLPPAE